MLDESRKNFRKAYAAGRNAYRRGTNDRAVSITAVITLLGVLFFELLAHYTTWPFVNRIGLTVVAIVLAKSVAGRFFNQLRPKS